MPMMIVKIGYDEYVLSVEDGLKVATLLIEAKKFELKYSNGAHSYHAYDHASGMECRIISDELYRLASLAGKPE